MANARAAGSGGAGAGRDLSWIVVGTGVSLLAGLVVAGLATRLFGISGVGLYFHVTSLSAVLFPGLILGADRLILRHQAEEMVGHTDLPDLGLSAALAWLGPVVVGPPLTVLVMYGFQLDRLTGLAFLSLGAAEGLRSFTADFHRGRGDFRASVLRGQIARSCTLLATFFLLGRFSWVGDRSALMLVVGATYFGVGALLFPWRHCRLLVRKVSWSSSRAVVAAGLGQAGHSMARPALVLAPVVGGGPFLVDLDLGLVGAASRLAAVGMLPMMLISKVALPRVAAGRPPRPTEALLVRWAGLGGAVLVLLILAAGGPRLARLVYGPELAGAGRLAAILVIPSVVAAGAVWEVSSSSIRMSGRPMLIGSSSAGVVALAAAAAGAHYGGPLFACLLPGLVGVFYWLWLASKGWQGTAQTSGRVAESRSHHRERKPRTWVRQRAVVRR